MSHYSTVESRIVSEPHLIKALKELGYHNVEISRAGETLHGMGNFPSSHKAEIILRSHVVGSDYDIGFYRDEDDFWNLIAADEDKAKINRQWLANVTRRYAYHVAIDTLKEKDFELVEETERQDDTIHLTLRRMT